MPRESTGCLLASLFAPVLAVLGTNRTQPRLTDARTLPKIDPTLTDKADRAALVRARKAAVDCMAALSAEGPLATSVNDQLADQVAGLLDGIYQLGAELQRARAFLRRHDPSLLARERAEVELELLGAPAQAHAALKQKLASLEERGRHAATVAREIGVLEYRLEAAAETMEGLHSRLVRVVADADSRGLRVEGVLSELKQRETETREALDAYVETFQEISDLG